MIHNGRIPEIVWSGVMGKRKTQQTLISGHESCEEGEGKGAGFFACYLLTSLCPRFKGQTYIGYTLNPRRRIRQHNGEIGSGACRTKKKRPWEMVFCIYGFPTNIAALQFEWAWQHPVESLAVRKAAASFKSLSGLANKIKLAYTMLTLPPWHSLNLTVNLFSTKYQSYTSGCSALPEQMCTRVCSMDDLPCYNVNDEWDDRECEGAARKLNDSPSCYDGSCSEENVPEQSNHKDNDESSGCVTKPSEGCSKKSSSISEVEDHLDQGPSSFLICDSPTRKSFSFASSSYIVEVEDMQSPTVDELTAGFPKPLGKKWTTSVVADKDLVWIKNRDISSREVEIIDVFTPSPCHVVNPGSTKRRQRLCPEIIDLTNSPLFV